MSAFVGSVGGGDITASQISDSSADGRSLITSPSRESVVDLGLGVSREARSDADADTASYLRRISVATVGDIGSTANTPSDPDSVRDSIAYIYDTVGKDRLLFAYFLSSRHNIIASGAAGVPEFLAAANNGTLTGSTLPTVGTNGTLFTTAVPNCITLPVGLTATLTDADGFTDIVICQPVGVNVARGVMGAFSNSGATQGYIFECRNSTTMSQRVLTLSLYEDAGASTSTLTARPELDNWQCVAASNISGTQRIFRNGRLMASGTSVVPIGITNRTMVIGAQGMRTDTSAISGGFNGEVIFAAKISGVLTESEAMRLMSGLRATLSPECGEINVVLDGDSRVSGMAFAGGQYTVDVTNDETPWIGYRLTTKSNWLGKTAVFHCGTSADTLRNILNSGQYEFQSRQFRPNGLQRTYYILHAGINDMQYGYLTETVADMYGWTKSILERAKADGCITVIVNQPEAQSGYQHGMVGPFNALLAAGHASGDLSSDYLIDVSDMSDVATPTWFDGLHYEAAGLDEIATRINAAVTDP